MQYYIKEWPDQKASLIAEDGYELEIYESVNEAFESCIKHCRVEPEYIVTHANYLGTKPHDFESSFV